MATGYWLHYEPKTAAEAAAHDGGASGSDRGVAASTISGELAPTSLMATRVMRDEDVFGLAAIACDEEDDIGFAKTTADALRAFFVPFGATHAEPLTKAQVDFKPLIRLLSDLIVFVTSTEEADPMKREGLPIPTRQTMLREQV